MTAVDLTRPNRRRALRNRRTTEGGGHWPLSRVFAVGTAVAVVLVVAVVTAGGVALWRLVEARSVAAAVGTPGLLAGQQLATALIDQETGVRGFAATRRPEFLEPYADGRDAERVAVDTLRALAPRGLVDFVPALEAAEQAAQDWRTGYAEPVLAGAADGSAPEVGKALFDRFRSASGALVADLQAQRTTAAGRTDAATNSLISVSIAIAALLIAFMVATGIGLRRAVLRPVSGLAAQVREVVTGGVQQQVHAGGPREMVELGEDIEAMRVHILHDLDDAQDVNRRLDEQARDLERSNRDLEQFAYVASHDLQEPLRKVSSFCQLLQRRYAGQLDDRADQYIEFAVDGAQRMQRLINDLLAFSRVGRNNEGFEPVDLAALAEGVATQLDTARGEVQGKIEIGDLPVLPGDRALLRQLLVNLIGNGLKFHREDVPPVVRVEATRTGDTWQFAVTDNGIGIEPEYADKVFVIFQRLHGRDAYPGTGIGLALAKKIVEFHGGRIGLAPTTGPGATIQFTLPATREEPSP